jgi:hypothetical protein
VDKKRKPYGYYSRLEWPYKGTALEQPFIVKAAFDIIKDEYARIQAGR